MVRHHPRRSRGQFGRALPHAAAALFLALGALPAYAAETSSLPESSPPPSEMESSVPSFPESVPPPETLFSDVPEGHQHRAAILWAKSRGIVQGYDDGLFRPSRPVSRVEALKTIYLAAGETPTMTEGAAFPDVPAEAWYLPFIIRAKADGVVHGYPDGRFRPDQVVSRTELLKMAFRVQRVNFYSASARGRFSDTPSGRWFVTYVNYAVDSGLLDVEGTAFFPDQGMAREDVVELLYRWDAAVREGRLRPLPAPVLAADGARTQEVSGDGKASYYHDSLTGGGTASGQKYDPAKRTCAHPSLPFGTVVTVVNAADDTRRTVCTVNDRGPYVNGRVLDLSRASFEEIASLSTGVVSVRWSATMAL